MSIRKILADTEMVKNTIYHILSKKLKEHEEPISDYELREIIFAMFESILGFDIEWADPEVYGKNRIVVHAGKEKVIANITNLMDSLRVIHKDYLEEKLQDERLYTIVNKPKKRK